MLIVLTYIIIIIIIIIISNKWTDYYYYFYYIACIITVATCHGLIQKFNSIWSDPHAISLILIQLFNS